MNDSRICPQCHDHISEASDSRIVFGALTICQCGWYDHRAERESVRKQQDRTSTALTVTMLFLVVFYSQAVSWGTHVLTIPLLRAQQASGLLSANGYQRLAQVCVETGHMDCAENALAQSYSKSSNPEALRLLSKLQLRLGKTGEAKQTYARYFQAGGKNYESMLTFAKMLELDRQDAKALSFYEASMQLESDRLPVQAVSGMVRLLMKKGQYREAYLRLRSFYASSGNARGYLNTEFQQIQLALRSQSARSLASVGARR